jgi:hypothetical protein
VIGAADRTAHREDDVIAIVALTVHVFEGDDL